jgi:hypothetical protein
MPYIGQQPTTGAFLELDSLTASATADYTLQLNGANYYPESVNNLLVSINGVIQGSSTMSLSGSTLTVGATLSSSDVIDFVRVFGNVGTISTPTDGSVTVNKLGTGAVTNAKIADSTIDLTSKVTGVLPSANSQTNTPYFYGKKASTQTITRNTTTIVTGFTNDEIDTDSAFDGTTFTVPSGKAGVYFFNASITSNFSGVGNDGERAFIQFRKNGSNSTMVSNDFTKSSGYNISSYTNQCSTILNLSVADTVEITVYNKDGNASGNAYVSGDSAFMGFKLIGA